MAWIPWDRQLELAGLTKLYRKGMRARNAVPIAHRIRQAVRVEDLAADVDRVEALVMAAELYRHAEYLGEALRCCQLSLARMPAGDGRIYPRLLYAKLLIETDRADEGWTILAELRPLLGKSFEAATLVPETLQEVGAPDTAVTWLTEAIDGLGLPGDGTADPLDVQLRNAMLAERRRIRAGLKLDPDSLDELAGEVAAAEQQAAAQPDERTPAAADDHAHPSKSHRIAVLYWPEPAFGAFAAKWPSLAEGYGGTWDGHRAEVAATLATYRATQSAKVVVVPATFEEFRAYASERGLDPTGPGARSGYALELARQGRGVEWPPERKAPCWCGSEIAYKRCCGSTAGRVSVNWE
ncbi:SEC-C domain-containing protein [Flindersiella endophytica]